MSYKFTNIIAYKWLVAMSGFNVMFKFEVMIPNEHNRNTLSGLKDVNYHKKGCNTEGSNVKFYIIPR